MGGKAHHSTPTIAETENVRSYTITPPYAIRRGEAWTRIRSTLSSAENKIALRRSASCSTKATSPSPLYFYRKGMYFASVDRWHILITFIVCSSDNVTRIMNTTVVDTSLGQLTAKITVGTRVFTLMCNLRIRYTTDQHRLTHPLVQFH